MFGIYPKSYQEILMIFEDCLSIDEVVIYGSRAKGNYREGSDIDITLKGEVTKEDLNKLWHFYFHLPQNINRQFYNKKP